MTDTLTNEKRYELFMLLADRLENMPRVHYEMQEAYRDNDADVFDEEELAAMRSDAVQIQSDGAFPTQCLDLEGWTLCGTVHCAMGWAGTMPEFQAVGFSLDKDGTPMYGVEHSWDAVESFMGLRTQFSAANNYRTVHPDAQYLFSSSEYPNNYTTADVVQRIREYASKHWKVESNA